MCERCISESHVNFENVDEAAEEEEQRLELSWKIYGIGTLHADTPEASFSPRKPAKLVQTIQGVRADINHRRFVC